MRTLAVCAALALGAGCAPVQTRTHYDRWLAKNDAAPEAAAAPAPSAAAPAPPAPAPVRETAAPARARVEPAPLPSGDTPAIERGAPPPRRGRALRPVEDDEDEQEAIY